MALSSTSVFGQRGEIETASGVFSFSKIAPAETESDDVYVKIEEEESIQHSLLEESEQRNAGILNPLTLALSHGGRGERSENSSTVQPFNSSPVRLLDIGTGGGFPSVPIAIFYDNINVFAIDSIRKKISVIEEMKADLELKNLFPVCGRVENLQFGNNPKAYDYITTRAVAPMDKILKYAMPNLKRGGYFIAYKSKKALEELKEAEKTLKLLGAKIEDIIEYTLPMEEVFERNLVIVKKR